MLSADLPAKALVLNEKQYNGQYGCSYCESQGSTPPGDCLHRYWPYEPNIVLRTHAGVVENAKEAVRGNDAVHIFLNQILYSCSCEDSRMGSL